MRSLLFKVKTCSDLRSLYSVPSTYLDRYICWWFHCILETFTLYQLILPLKKRFLLHKSWDGSHKLYTILVLVSFWRVKSVTQVNPRRELLILYTVCRSTFKTWRQSKNTDIFPRGVHRFSVEINISSQIYSFLCDYD